MHQNVGLQGRNDRQRYLDEVLVSVDHQMAIEYNQPDPRCSHSTPEHLNQDALIGENAVS